MRRIGLAVVLALSLLGPRAAEGQATKVPRVGYLVLSPLVDPPSAERQAFLNGLRDLGYVIGQTIAIEYRSAAWNRELLPDLAAELVDLKVDVIMATPGTVDAARQATRTIPIVFTAAADPVASRFAVSLSHPGGNMTGLAQPGPVVTGKRMSFLKEAVAKLSRVAIVRNPTGVAHVHDLPVAQESALALRLQSRIFDSRGPQDFESVFRAISNDRVQAVLLLPDSTFYIGREQLAQLALRYQLPMIGNRAEYARAGVLLGYGSILSEEWRRAGVLVGKILNGAKPADIPIEEPSKFELVINVKTALTIPPSLLLRADQVIE